MTTATEEKNSVDMLEIEIGELIASYRACQEQVKAWEDEKNREVRPVLERKMAERGASVWECSYGRALYIDAKGQVDYEAAFETLAHEVARIRAAVALPSDITEALDAIRPDGYRRPAQRRFEVRAPLRIFVPKDEAAIAAKE